MPVSSSKLTPDSNPPSTKETQITVTRHSLSCRQNDMEPNFFLTKVRLAIRFCRHFWDCKH
uniref:Uncharacterized protein n=1 Tax=Manihot esculenta TaxID=3983 RepID=A0A2C9W1B5_MANES